MIKQQQQPSVSSNGALNGQCDSPSKRVIVKAKNLSQHEALLNSDEHYDRFLDAVSCKDLYPTQCCFDKGVNLVEQFQQYQTNDDEHSLTVQLFLDSVSSCCHDFVLSAVINTLQELKRTHIDILLIKTISAQQALEYWPDAELLVNNGLVKQIGVCDFNVEELQAFSKSVTIQPHVLQVNLASYETLESLNELTQYCSSTQISVLTGSRGSLNDFKNAGKKLLGESSNVNYVARYSLVCNPTSVVEDMGFIVKLEGSDKCTCISGEECNL